MLDEELVAYGNWEINKFEKSVNNLCRPWLFLCH